MDWGDPLKLLIGAVIATSVGLLAEYLRRRWQKDDARRLRAEARTDEHARWTREARIKTYSQMLADERLAVDAAIRLSNLTDPFYADQRDRWRDKLDEGLARFEVSYAQTVLVASKNTHEAVDLLRTKVLEVAMAALQGNDLPDIQMFRVGFVAMAKIELGLTGVGETAAQDRP